MRKTILAKIDRKVRKVTYVMLNGRGSRIQPLLDFDICDEVETRFVGAYLYAGVRADWCGEPGIQCAEFLRETGSV